MARHDDRDRIRAVGEPDGAARVGTPDRGRELLRTSSSCAGGSVAQRRLVPRAGTRCRWSRRATRSRARRDRPQEERGERPGDRAGGARPASAGRRSGVARALHARLVVVEVERAQRVSASSHTSSHAHGDADAIYEELRVVVSCHCLLGACDRADESRSPHPPSRDVGQRRAPRPPRSRRAPATAMRRRRIVRRPPPSRAWSPMSPPENASGPRSAAHRDVLRRPLADAGQRAQPRDRRRRDRAAARRARGSAARPRASARRAPRRARAACRASRRSAPASRSALGKTRRQPAGSARPPCSGSPYASTRLRRRAARAASTVICCPSTARTASSKPSQRAGDAQPGPRRDERREHADPRPRCALIARDVGAEIEDAADARDDRRQRAHARESGSSPRARRGRRCGVDLDRAVRAVDRDRPPVALAVDDLDAVDRARRRNPIIAVPVVRRRDS